MPENTKLIIFDFDGVLVDTKQSILYTFQRALEKQGHNYSIVKIERYIGQKPEKVISDLIPQDDTTRKEKIVNAKKEYDKILCSEEGLNKVKLLLVQLKQFEQYQKRNTN